MGIFEEMESNPHTATAPPPPRACSATITASMKVCEQNSPIVQYFDLLSFSTYRPQFVAKMAQENYVLILCASIYS